MAFDHLQYKAERARANAAALKEVQQFFRLVDLHSYAERVENAVRFLDSVERDCYNERERLAHEAAQQE